MNERDSIDRSALDTLHEVTGGDPDFMAELIDTYFADTAQLLEILRQSLASGDAEQFRRAAHSLKSTSASFGAHRLEQLCRELEERGKHSMLVGAEPLLTQVETEYELVKDALKTVRDSGSMP